MKCLPDNIGGLTANQAITSDAPNRARFMCNLKNNVDYGRLGSTGVYTIAGGAGNLATADSLLTHSGPLAVAGAGGARETNTGGDIVGKWEHIETNFHPANSIVVGNLWGTQIESKMIFYSHQTDRNVNGIKAEGQAWTEQLSTIHVEIVVEPLHNEPKQSNFSVEDEKNRQRF